MAAPSVLIRRADELEAAPTERFTFERGYKRYEVSNHLGNVLAVISDCKIAQGDVCDEWTHFEADIHKLTDYYPFGMEKPGRTAQLYSNGTDKQLFVPGTETSGYTVYNDKYRFAFNGKEDDKEWGKQDYGFRMYDPQIARFISADPLIILQQQYPELSPYQFASNTPIQGVDIDGLEVGYVQYGVRAAVPLLGVASNIGIAVDADLNVQPYVNVSGGPAFGVYVGTGLGVGLSWDANTTDDILGYGGISTGFAVAYGAKIGGVTLNVVDASHSEIGIKGIGVDIGGTGPGIGFTAFIEYSYTFPIGDRFNLRDISLDGDLSQLYNDFTNSATNAGYSDVPSFDLFKETVGGLFNTFQLNTQNTVTIKPDVCEENECNDAEYKSIEPRE